MKTADKEHMDQERHTMFTSVNSRSVNTYKAVAVETAIPHGDPHRLVEMMFDSVLTSVAAARAALARGDIQTKSKHIGSAIRVLNDGLVSSLNFEAGGDIAVDMNRLYDFCNMRLTTGNARNDDAALADVVHVLEPIAQAWKQIGSDPRIVSRLM